MTGTYNELDQSNSINIVANIDDYQICLHGQQELCVYSKKTYKDIIEDKPNARVKSFIEGVTDLSSGYFAITQDGQVLFHSSIGNYQTIFECQGDEQIICTSKLNKVENVFGSDSIFDTKFSYMFAVSTKSSDPLKINESNLYTFGLALLNIDVEEGPIFEIVCIKRTISYPIITAIMFLLGEKESNKKYKNKHAPHVLLG